MSPVVYIVIHTEFLVLMLFCYLQCHYHKECLRNVQLHSKENDQHLQFHNAPQEKHPTDGHFLAVSLLRILARNDWRPMPFTCR